MASGGGDDAAAVYRAGVSDADIVEHEAAIRAEVAASQPLVGRVEPSSVLLSAYADNPPFLAKLSSFVTRYAAIRRARGDGSCFYRSLLVSLAEQFVAAGVRYSAPGAAPAAGAAPGPVQAAYDSLLAHVDGATAALIALGYPESTTPDFLTVLAGYLRGLGAPGATVDASVIAPLNDDGSDAAVYGLYALRLLTSLELRGPREDAYVPFVLGTSEAPTMELFCASEVETPAHDADQPQIMALATALRVRVVIAYLDASPGGMHELTLPDDSALPEPPVMTVHLLYRPGHYDVAYRA
jgi:ubiquitin thioesterase protein OTUB1